MLKPPSNDTQPKQQLKHCKNTRSRGAVSVSHLVCELRCCGQRLYLSINFSHSRAYEILYGWHSGVPAQVLGNCKEQNIQHRERVQQLYVLHKPYVNNETLCVSTFMKYVSSLRLKGSSNVTALAYMGRFGLSDKKKSKDNSGSGSQGMLTH